MLFLMSICLPLARFFFPGNQVCWNVYKNKTKWTIKKVPSNFLMNKVDEFWPDLFLFFRFWVFLGFLLLPWWLYSEEWSNQVYEIKLKCYCPFESTVRSIFSVVGRIQEMTILYMCVPKGQVEQISFQLRVIEVKLVR